MNIYALIPLFATIAYIPLLVTTISSHPWGKKHKLFTFFLIAAMTWSLIDYFFRSNVLPQYNLFLLKGIIVALTLMAVQLHCFASSFYAPGHGRWLPFAYGSLVAVIALVALGYVPEGFTTSGDKLYPEYGKGVIFIAIPLLTLVARNLYVFQKRLKILNNPVLYNQIVSLRLGVIVLTIFVLTGLLPWGREYPVSHFGNLINALILSYATIRHQLLDIRFVLRRGLAWIGLGIIGVGSYWLLLLIIHAVFRFEFNPLTEIVVTLSTILIVILLYKLRGLLFATFGKAFQGQSYDYRQKLSDFASKIHNVFSLKEQGGELLALVTRAIGCKKACLLFLATGSEDFTAQLVEPKDTDNPLSSLTLKQGNPILQYLRGERQPLTRESLSILPEFRSLWTQEKEEIKSNDIELFMPLISRDKLIGVLVLDKKKSGRYQLEDFQLLENITKQVAVSMEKEYLREQLRQREEELSVINRSSAIITSSLDIQRIYDSFIKELKRVVEVDWAAIALIEENELHFLALSSEIGSAWKAGERLPIKGSATEWLAIHRKAVIEPDLTQECRFSTGKYHLQQGVRSILYLPLIVKDKVIGSLVVASRKPNAYNQRHIKLLEQLTSQIAMPIENSQLYIKAEEKARIDELTGLLNRRSLDEQINSEISRHSRYGGVFSIIALDLDSFKTFNDRNGHLAGDQLLSRIGAIMKSSIRDADQAFRYGGDEFAILLPQTTNEAAYKVAERVRQRLASEVNAGHIKITASLGLASWPVDGIAVNELIDAADGALYKAKRSGGNQSLYASRTLLPSDEIMATPGNNEDSEALSTIYALAATVDARDHYTRSHSKKVNEYAVALAEAIELEPLEISKLSNCALLHDIGKIGISNEILNKRGRLTSEEWEQIKVHPQLGASIISHVRHLAPCILGILHHHERYDGTGYPKGLNGEEIPPEARILAIADAFAAMTSDRQHSEALSYEEAIKEIKRNAGKQFDPTLVNVFLTVIETAPVAITREEIRG